MGADFYISSKICTSFLMTVPESSSGWMLSFMSKNQSQVFYDEDIWDVHLVEDKGYHR